MAKIFLVKESYLADKKVYFVKEDFLADEKVYVVKDSFLADYKAFEVKEAFLADVKVFRVKDSFLADSFKRSSKIPKSSDFFRSSRDSGSSYSGNSSSKSYSSSSSYDSDDSDSSSNSGCGKKAFYWFVFIVLIGWGLKQLGILEDNVSSLEDSSGKIINTKGLNLRTEPGITGEIIKLMIQNDSIWQLKDSSQEIGSQNWIYVTDRVDTGWVNSRFLK